jgi:hypothetical protein
MYTPMVLRVWVIGLLGLVVVPGCGERDDDALAGRVQALEQRMAAIDRRLAAIDQNLPTSERMQSDLHALEQRLGGVEAKATEALETAKAPPPPRAPTVTGPRGRREGEGRSGPDPAERRAQLGALMTEYRRRLDEVKRQGSGTSPAELMAARREVRDWYIARRRAILSGQPLPD